MSWLEDIVGNGIDSILKGAGGIIEKVVLDPNKKSEAMLEIQRLALQGQQLVMDAEKARLGDIADARALYNKDSSVQKALAIIVTVAFFGLIIMILWLLKASELPQWQENLIFTLFGAVAALMTTVFSFYFGSSKGSGDKDATIAVALKEAAANRRRLGDKNVP